MVWPWSSEIAMDCSYAQELTKQAVVRAAIALGIKTCDRVAIEAIADVLKHYIQAIGTTAKNQAEVAGRAAPGVTDVLDVLKNTRPFNVTFKDLKDFALEDEQQSGEDANKMGKWFQPFPFSVSAFPIDLPLQDPVDSGLVADVVGTKDNRDPFVPAHLPPYPPKYTYSRTSTRKRALDSQAKADAKAMESKEKKQMVARSARHSLAKLEDSVDNVE